MRQLYRSTFLAVLTLVLFYETASGYIRVGPTAVYLSDRNRSGVISIASVAPVPIDVRLDLFYGYITSDTLGSPMIFIDEHDTGNPKSCAPWITINPKRFTLLPGESRAIRFIARPPDGLQDGEYWSRLVIGVEARKDLDDGEGKKSISASQQMNPKTVIPISYRKGECFADIKLTNVFVRPDSAEIHVDVEMMPMGNAAYIGNMSVVIRDQAKKELLSKKIEIAVFSTFRRRFSIPLPRMPKGRYATVITYDTDRPDMGANALHVLPKTYTVEFQLR